MQGRILPCGSLIPELLARACVRGRWFFLPLCDLYFFLEKKVVGIEGSDAAREEDSPGAPCP